MTAKNRIPPGQRGSSFVSPEKYELWQMMHFRRESFAQWQVQQRASLGSPADTIALLADVLRPMLLFLAKGSGLNPKATRGPKIGTLHMRAWVLLYAIRPDLINGETMRAAAKRFGVTPIRIGDLMREFCVAVPHFDAGIEERRRHAMNPNEASANHSKSTARVWEQRRRSAEFWRRKKDIAA